MRHQKEGRKLGRTASHRKSLLASLSTALILHKKITTTTAKAKETRRIVEPIITRARNAFMEEKSGKPVNVHARREVYRFIRDRQAIAILFGEIAEKVGNRPGGYTRVLKLGNRLGDGAEMSVIELVDYNEAQDLKKRRQRVERSKAAQEKRRKADVQPKAASAAEVAAPVAEAPVVDEAVVEAPMNDIVPEVPVVEAAAETPADAPVAEAEAPATDEAAPEATEGGEKTA